MNRLFFSALGFLFVILPCRADDSSSLDPLIEVLAISEEAQFQLDILKGISAALKGQRDVPEPEGWPVLAKRLVKSPNTEVAEFALTLSLKFGSQAALDVFRSQLEDASLGLAKRERVLEALVEAKDAKLPSVLFGLLDDSSLQRAALRGLAAFENPKTSGAILARFSKMKQEAKLDALSTLASRRTYAAALMVAVENKTVLAKALPADVVRQLRAHGDKLLNKKIDRLWGVSRSTPEAKLKEIEKYKRIAKLRTSVPNNLSKGRALFNRVCVQCHKLYGEGGEIGPDITGSDRKNLEYIISNIIDPNGEISNDYRTTIVRLKDDRVLVGVIRGREGKSITVATPVEVVSVAKQDVASVEPQNFSMMPEGLVLPFSDQELRELVAYLMGEGQVPLP
jgi:putative heme-binding domain-containing protein